MAHYILPSSIALEKSTVILNLYALLWSVFFPPLEAARIFFLLSCLTRHKDVSLIWVFFQLSCWAFVGFPMWKLMSIISTNFSCILSLVIPFFSVLSSWCCCCSNIATLGMGWGEVRAQYPVCIPPLIPLSSVWFPAFNCFWCLFPYSLAQRPLLICSINLRSFVRWGMGQSTNCPQRVKEKNLGIWLLLKLILNVSSLWTTSTPKFLFQEVSGTVKVLCDWDVNLVLSFPNWLLRIWVSQM